MENEKRKKKIGFFQRRVFFVYSNQCIKFNFFNLIFVNQVYSFFNCNNKQLYEKYNNYTILLTKLKYSSILNILNIK